MASRVIWLVGMVPLAIVAAILHMAYGNHDGMVHIIWSSPTPVTIEVDGKTALEAPGAGNWAVRVPVGAHTIRVFDQDGEAVTALDAKTSGRHLLVPAKPNQCFVEVDAWDWATHPTSRPPPTRFLRHEPGDVIPLEKVYVGIAELVARSNQRYAPPQPVVLAIACDLPVDEAWLRAQFPASQPGP